jgi:uncharacterized damage-inducible protein DinB
MTYYGSKELAAAFRTVRNNTVKIAEDIPEEKYGFQVAPGTRTAAQTLVHIAKMCRVPQMIHFEQARTSLEGFNFLEVLSGLIAEEQVSRTKQQIIDMLRTEGEKFAGQLEGASEEFLAEIVTYPAGMMPPTKTRFEMLMGAKEHEMHHRGQLMMMERMIGIVPHLTRQMMDRIAAMQASKAGA